MKQKDVATGMLLVPKAGAREPRYIIDRGTWVVIEVIRAVTRQAPLDVTAQDAYSGYYRYKIATDGFLVRIAAKGSGWNEGLSFLSKGGDPKEPDRASDLRWLPAEQVRLAQPLMVVEGWLAGQKARHDIQSRRWAEREALHKRLTAQAKLIVEAARAAGIDLWAAPDNYDLAIHVVEAEIQKLRAVLEAK